MSNAALKAAATGEQAQPTPTKFPAMLEAYKRQIALALPRHMNADRMARVALTCFRMTPKLGECDPASVFACIIQAAQLGLEPGLNGEAYLVPFRNNQKNRMECQLIPGYRGLIKLARNTGEIESVSARIVYEKDDFTLEFGTDERVVHKPLLTGDRGKPLAVYCIAKFKSGGHHIEPMTWSQVMAIKARSKTSGSGPWVTDTEEMARKTVIRRASKYWPMSIELAQAIDLDNAAATGIAQGLDIGDTIAGEHVVIPEAQEPAALTDGLPQDAINVLPDDAERDLVPALAESQFTDRIDTVKLADSIDDLARIDTDEARAGMSPSQITLFDAAVEKRTKALSK